MSLPHSRTVPALLAPGPGRKRASTNLHETYVESSPRLVRNNRRMTCESFPSKGEGANAEPDAQLEESPLKHRSMTGNTIEQHTRIQLTPPPRVLAAWAFEEVNHTEFSASRNEDRTSEFTEFGDRAEAETVGESDTLWSSDGQPPVMPLKKKLREVNGDMKELLDTVSEELSHHDAEDGAEAGDADNETASPTLDIDPTSTYPVPYFFYGTLANTKTLRKVLNLPSEPRVKKARIRGLIKVRWADRWTLVPKKDAEQQNSDISSSKVSSFSLSSKILGENNRVDQVQDVQGIVYMVSSKQEDGVLDAWASTTWKPATVEIEILPSGLRRGRKIEGKTLVVWGGTICVISEMTERNRRISKANSGRTGGEVQQATINRHSDIVEDGLMKPLPAVESRMNGSRARLTSDSPNTGAVTPSPYARHVRTISESPSLHLPTVRQRPPTYNGASIQHTEAMLRNRPRASTTTEFKENGDLRDLCQDVFELSDKVENGFGNKNLPTVKEETVKEDISTPNSKRPIRRSYTEKALPKPPITDYHSSALQMFAGLAPGRRSVSWKDKPLPSLPRESSNILEKDPSLKNIKWRESKDTDAGAKENTGVTTDPSLRDIE